MKNNKKKGFTIVELVIVIAIIAILAAVLIPTFSNVIKKANESACLQAAKSKFEELYAIDYADGTLNGLDTKTEGTPAVTTVISTDTDVLNYFNENNITIVNDKATASDATDDVTTEWLKIEKSGTPAALPTIDAVKTAVKNALTGGTNEKVTLTKGIAWYSIIDNKPVFTYVDDNAVSYYNGTDWKTASYK